MNTNQKPSAPAKVAHTPGPWWLDDDGFISSGSGDSYRTIADPRCMKPAGNQAEIDANARLIAAAPELLAALQSALDYIATGRGNPEVIRPAARAALAKAEGRK